MAECVLRSVRQRNEHYHVVNVVPQLERTYKKVDREFLIINHMRRTERSEIQLYQRPKEASFVMRFESTP